MTRIKVLAALLVGLAVGLAAVPAWKTVVATYDVEKAAVPEGSRAPAAKSPETPMAGGEKKPLYYRNPMGLPDTSSTPKKDWMGMDYIAVYEGEEATDGSTVKVSLDKVQRAGVRSEAVELRRLERPVRAPAVAKVDERTLRDVTLRADGFVEKLYVNETGKHVKAGEPLFRLYSPAMLRALIDFQVDAKVGGRRETLLSSRQNLANYEVPETAIAELKRTGAAPMAFDWPSPASGVVIEKKAVEGQMARMGEMLFRIADLSSIWVVADVAEQDAGSIKVGAPASVTFRAFPGERFDGRVTFILHELDMNTRTAKVRIEVANPDHRIKHDMFADVVINAGDKDAPRVAVPNSAILNTGVKQVVLIDKGEGRFEPREVKVGARGEAYTEVAEGVTEGEKVVVSANFLIDAESNLRTALGAFTAGDRTEAAPSGSEPGEAPEDAAHGGHAAERKP